MTAALLVTVAAVVILLITTELVAAIIPLVLVVTLVPAEDRKDLAELLAAADSSRRLRLWPALRTAVRARRTTLSRTPSRSRP